MHNPVISVLMGVRYRKEDTGMLCRSIDSVLNQDFRDFEFLICDDGSTEEARAVIDGYAQKDSRLRIIRKGGLLTLPEKLNACLKEAVGEYIARMDDDDFSHPERFGRQYGYLCENRDIGWVGCNVNLYRDGKPEGVRTLPERPVVRDFLFAQPYVHPTLIFRKEVLDAAGGYSEEKICSLCEDYDLLMRLYELGYHGGNLQESLFDYTLPSNNRRNRTFSQRCDESRMRHRHFKKLGLLPKAWPYVIKPVVLGILPMQVIKFLKKNR